MHQLVWRYASCALLAVVLVLQSGCEDESQPAGSDNAAITSNEQSTGGTQPASDGNSANDATAEPGENVPPVMLNTAPPAKIVEVKLADRDAETCLIKQGDAFPQTSLPDAAGSDTALEATFGQVATVVLFWAPDNEYSVQWLEDLLFETVGKQQGVNVTTVCVSTDTQAATQTLSTKMSEASLAQPNGFAALTDADSSLYDQVSTGPLPRLYLLDPQGKVLWFCIDYSNASYEELQSALRFVSETGGE